MRTALLLVLTFHFLSAQDSLNLEVFGQYHRGDSRYSGTWSYIGPDSSEYALLGAFTGTAIYSIDEADQIDELAFIPGPNTRWREITTIGHFAYVVTDVQGEDHGMQVIDLSYLPDSAVLVTNYQETFTTAHIIQKDIFSDSAYVYAMGTSTTSGVHILDVSTPASPVEVGLYQPGYYIHDAHIRGDRLYAAAFYETTMDIVDISDKTNPVLLTRLSYNGNNTHSSTLTMDEKYIMIADEADGLPGRMWNIEDLDDMFEVATYSANLQSLVHNPYIRDDFIFISHNTEGLRVLDVADPTVPVEVAFYDTWFDASGGFNGLWSACPYFPSGKIIGGNRHDGLYIWTFNEIHAGRFYGLVRDTFSQLPIFNAGISVDPIGETINSDLEGQFKAGYLPGSYTLEITSPGYEPKTITVDLLEGSQEDLLIDLVPESITNIEEPLKQPDLRIMPNPMEEETQIDLSNFPTVEQLLLYNAAGQGVWQAKINGESTFILRRGELASGPYMLQLRDNNKKVLAIKQLVIGRSR